MQGNFSNDQATLQQYVLGKAYAAVKLPSSISFEAGSTIILCLATAALPMCLPADRGGAAIVPPWTEDGKGKYAGQSFVVIGGSSSVGQYAIQVARMAGFSTIVTSSSLKHADYLKSLGATHVIDRAGDVTSEAAKILSGGVTDYVYDAIADETTTKISANLTSDNGVLISVGPLDEKEVGKSVRTVSAFGSLHMYRNLGGSLTAALPGLLENGDIKVSFNRRLLSSSI